MKLEVGMYCYNKTNRKLGIGKIISFQRNNNVNIKYKNDIELVSSGNVIASFNIIDILKVGDFLDNHCIIKIENDTCYLNDGWFINADDIENLVTSVCTKEQMEQMEYKVGE